MKNILLFRKPKGLLFWSFALLFLLFHGKGFGQVVFTENFNYTSGTTLILNGYTASSGTGTNNLTVGGTGLTYTGSPSNGIGVGLPMTTSGEDVGKLFTSSITSGTAYMSFLVRISAAQSTGDYFTGIFTGTASSPGFGVRIYAKSSGAGFVMGVGKTNATPVYDTGVLTFNQTYYIVAKYTYNTGTATDDTVSLWVVPSFVLGGTESTPTLTTGSGATDQGAFTGAYFRQGTAANAPTLIIDGVRAGTTWASVTSASSLINGGGTSTTAFSTTYGTASASQSFAVSGSLLTNNLVATAQTGFEVSRNDDVSYGASASYTAAEANAGGISFLVRLKDNASAGNYNGQNAVVLSSGSATTVNIVTSASGNTVSPLGLTITGLDSQDKQFDGTTTATLIGTPTLNGVLFSDDVVLSGTAVANYSSAAVGGPYAITVTGFSLSGTKAGNYSLAQPTVTDRSITPSSLLNQVITFPSLTDVLYGTASVALLATSDNPEGNPITYSSSNTSVATISGNTAVIVGAGTTTITASQAGSGTHNPAIAVTQNLTVTPLGISITGISALDKPYDGTTIATLTGTAVLDPAPINGDDVTISGTPIANFATADSGLQAVTVSGYTLGGTKAGNYLLTQPVIANATITPLTQTITFFGPIPTLTSLTPAVTLSATASSALPVTFESSDTNVATIDGNVLTIVGIGSVTITAKQAGNTNYAAAPDLMQTRLVETALYLNQFTGTTGTCPTQGNIPVTALNSSGNEATRSTVVCVTSANLFTSNTLNNTASINNASYVQFSTTAATGYRLNLTKMSFLRSGSNTAPNQLEVRYSIDGFATSTSMGNIALTPTSATTLTWDFDDFVSPVSGTVTFRLYPYGTQRVDLTGTAASSAGTFRLDDVVIYGTVESAPPTVTTTSPASNITSTSATLGGNVTNIGGSAITGNGIVIALTSDNPNPTINGAGVTQEANGSFSTGTGVFTLGTTVSLASNKQYSFRAYAANINGTVYGNSVTFYTLAQTPTTAITVSNPEVDSLDLDLSAASSPNTDTQIAIRVQSGSNTYYVQSDGTLGATAVWQYENGSSQTPQWSSALTVTGLLSNTLYTFDVKARNVAAVETGFGPTASGTTLENLAAFLTVTTPLADFVNVCTTGSNSFGIGSFTFDGANLNSTNLTVGSLSTELTFSLTQNGTYSNPLSITNSSTSLTAQQVWVKFTPSTTGAFSGTIAVSGGGLSPDFTFGATGTGVNTPVSVTTGLASGISSIGATLSGSYAQGCSEVTNSGIEYSINNNMSSSTTVALNTAVTGLQANTIYYYRAFATDATGTVNGSVLNFTTSGLAAPTANDVSNVAHNEFTANWTAVDGASSYRLDVSTLPNFGTSTTNLNQTLVSNSGTIGASGWTETNVTQGSGGYLSLVSSSSTVISPTIDLTNYSNINLNFKARTFGGVNASNNTITVSITTNNGSSWTTLGTRIPLNTTLNAMTLFNLSSYTGSQVKIRFQTLGANGTVGAGIDDIIVTGDESYFTPSFVSGYQDLNVGNVVSYDVDTNINPLTQYYFRVRAFSANSTSANSNTKSVTTTASPPTFGSVSQSLAEIICDGSEGTFNITGLLPQSTSTITYNINGGSNQTVAGVVANLSGFATFAVTLPASFNGQTLTITQVERTDIASPILTVTTNNTAVIAVQSKYLFYVDVDGDGYGSTTSSMECSSSAAVAPTGFSTNNTDCNDGNGAINPGTSEINFNNVDEDCDGSKFNGHAPVVSNITTASGTLAAMTTDISCSVATNTTPYSGSSVVHKFKVTRTSPAAAPVEFERASRTFAISELAIAAYSATYEVQATAIVNGEEQPYNGNTATFTTPAAPVIPLVSQVVTNQCNQTLATINSYIYANNSTMYNN
ncbi:hypothetical protein IVB69_05550, partial [Flavobacterium sp. J49]|uniref:beta strand repeat-containing protein n=1 Tax=Flavobacterium sp. J49 TaxID=2718534 RepID=UPI001592BF61